MVSYVSGRSPEIPPQHIREKLGITPATEVEFVEEKGKVYIIKRPGPNKSSHRFRKLMDDGFIILSILKFLQNYFNTFDIYFEKGDLEIDVEKQVLRSSGVKMTVTVDTLNKIRDYVAKLRTGMVTP